MSVVDFDKYRKNTSIIYSHKITSRLTTKIPQLGIGMKTKSKGTRGKKNKK